MVMWLLMQMTEQVSATVQGLLDQPAFTFWISANSSQPIVGELTFGAVKSKYYTGSLVKLPVDSQVGAPPSLGREAMKLEKCAVSAVILRGLHRRCQDEW